MKMEELERDLIIKSSLCTLGEKELKELYFDDDKLFIPFLECMYDEFNCIGSLPLEITDKYDFLKTEIMKKVNSDDCTEIVKNLGEIITARINYENKMKNRYNDDYITEYLYSKNFFIGANRLNKHFTSYEKEISVFGKKIGEYNNLKNEEFPTDEELDEIIVSGDFLNKIKGQEFTAKYFNEIKKLYPVLKLCYDPEMLVSLNYALTKNIKQDEKIKLTNDIKRIIDISINTYTKKGLAPLYNRNFDEKEYRGIAKSSKYLINKIETIEKHEVKEKRKKFN